MLCPFGRLYSHSYKMKTIWLMCTWCTVPRAWSTTSILIISTLYCKKTFSLNRGAFTAAVSQKFRWDLALKESTWDFVLMTLNLPCRFFSIFWNCVCFCQKVDIVCCVCFALFLRVLFASQEPELNYSLPLIVFPMFHELHVSLSPAHDRLSLCFCSLLYYLYYCFSLCPM